MSAPTPRNDRQQEMADELSLIGMLSLSDWRRFVPETAGLIVVLSAVSLLLTGRTSPPAVFWIPVLLMSGQYGIMGGLFSAIAASFMLYIDGLPPQSAAQDFYAYAAVVAAQPAAWFATALVFGGLRTLHIHHETRLRDQFAQSQREGIDLADALERSLQEVQHLERRIAADASTLASLLHHLAQLDLRDVRSLTRSTADVIRYGVGANSFAIYLSGPKGFEPCLGIQDGTHLAPEAIPPLPPEFAGVPLDCSSGTEVAIDNASASGRIGQPIRLAGSSEPLGFVICSRLMPSRDRAIARRRLREICDLLAVLLSACPDTTADIGATPLTRSFAYEAG